jgi:hypothetical protein
MSRGRPEQCEVFTSGLVRQFGELADQLLESQSHLVIVNGFGMKVDTGELLGDKIK